MKYRPEIDGLRALAVVPVILFHAGVPGFGGGYVGVDVFFVISGFLITTIILNDIFDNKFSLLDFYERRARRILPALFFVVAACFPFAWLWLGSEDFEGFARSVVAVALFSSNILFWTESGYFDAATELKPLLHTWSLAVEEQFYIFFPLFLILLHRYRLKNIAVAMIIMLVCSLALCQWAAYASPKANYFLLPTRAWELLIGSLVAVYIKDRKEVTTEWKDQLFSMIGIGLLLWAIFLFDKNTPFPSVYALVPTVGAALIILFANQGTVANALLSSRAMVGIGLVSYSAYLWHQPVIAFAKHRATSDISTSVQVAILISISLLSYLTWRYVENPFRNKSTFNRGTIFSKSLAALLVLVSLGLAVSVNRGFDSREVGGVTLGVLDQYAAANHGLSPVCDGKFTLDDACSHGRSPSIVLWGDSYAMHLAQALVASPTKMEFRQHTLNACSPIPGVAALTYDSVGRWAKECIDQNDKVLDWILKNPSVRLVVISSPFSSLLSEEIFYDGKVRKYSYEELISRARNVVSRLRTAGKQVVFVSPPPRNGRDLGSCYSKAVRFSINVGSCDFLLRDVSDRYLWAEKFLRDVERFAPVLWLSDLTCQGGLCKTSMNGIPLYRDSGHLSVDGSEMLGKEFDLMAKIIEAGIRMPDNNGASKSGLQ